MELRCVSARGVRDGSLLSVKAGTKRCIVPYDSETFGKDAQRLCGISGEEQVKVEIFEPVSQARLIVEPGEARWDVVLLPRPLQEEDETADIPDEGSERGVMSLELELAKSPGVPGRGRGRSEDSAGRAASARPVVGAGGSSSASKARHQGALTEAKMQPYFEKHSLFKVMQALLQAVIKERPADPYAYMVQMLQNSSQSAARRMQSSISSNGHPSTPEAAVFAGCLKSGRRTRGNSHSVAFREEAGVPTAAEAAAGMACGGGTAAAEEAVAAAAAAAAAKGWPLGISGFQPRPWITVFSPGMDGVQGSPQQWQWGRHKRTGQGCPWWHKGKLGKTLARAMDSTRKQRLLQGGLAWGWKSCT